MISYEQFCKIKHLQKQEGLNASQIAGELKIDYRTVVKWLEKTQYEQRAKTYRKSKLDPFKENIVKMLESHNYSATQIFNRIKEDGFEGGFTILREYVNKVRPRRYKAYLKLTFMPGECAQVDWGSYGSVNVGNTKRRLSFFVMVLCYSRMIYVEFTLSQTMEHFLGCHKNAFDFFGGCPEKVMVDNLKSAVLKRVYGAEPVYNPKYMAFANSFDFEIVPCGVAKGNEKGRVENGVGYVKKNFLRGLEIPNFEAINPAVKNWMDTIANVRIHGETKKRPVDLYKEEKKSLKPLPANSYDIANISQVRASRQFRITVDTNRYSVPAEYSGQRLTLKLYPDRICIYEKEKLIARHARNYGRHQDFEDPDHPKQLLLQRRKARDNKILMRFLALSPVSTEYYKNLEQRRLNPIVHIRKIVALSEIYGRDDVSRALEDAFTFQAFSSEYIENLLEQRSRIIPQAGALSLTRGEDLLELEVENPDLSLY